MQNKMHLTANELYNKLIQAGIIDSEGFVSMSLLGVTFNLNAKSAIGNILEEWLKNWMLKNDIYLDKTKTHKKHQIITCHQMKKQTCWK